LPGLGLGLVLGRGPRARGASRLAGQAQILSIQAIFNEC